MDFFEQLEQGRYGSFELKKIVGPNLMRGLVISVIIHALVIATPYIITAIRGEEEIPPMPVRVIDISTLLQLRSEENTAEQVRISQPKMAPPKAAKPIAVPEEEVPQDQALLPTQTEIKAQLSSSVDTALDIKAGEKIEIRDDIGAIPPMGTFQAFEVPPQPLASVKQPDFPVLAKTAEVTGKVIVQVYVDKHGDVKKWKIVKETPPNLGFGEEVEKVMPQWKFTPAIQQGNPVGVWVAVPFNFKYKKQ